MVASDTEEREEKGQGGTPVHESHSVSREVAGLLGACCFAQYIYLTAFEKYGTASLHVGLYGCRIPDH